MATSPEPAAKPAPGAPMPSNRPEEATGNPMPDQTAGAGPVPLDQSDESDDSQRNLKGPPAG